MTEMHHNILRALRYDGALDQFQIAASIAEPAFRVRAELRELHRQGYVRHRDTGTRIVWFLTGNGEQVAYDADQLRCV